MANKPGKRGKYDKEFKEKKSLHSTQRSFKHRETNYKEPEEFERYKEPEFDLQQFMQEIM